MKLFQRFFLSLVLLAVVPLTLAGLKMLQYHRLAQQTVTDFHLYAAKSLATQLDDFFSYINQSMAFLWEIERDPAISQERRYKLIANAHAAHSDFAGITFLNEDGKIVLRMESDEVRNDSSLPSYIGVSEYQEALKATRVQLGNVYSHGGLHYMDIFYPLPASPGKNGRQMVVIQVSLERVWRSLQELKIGKTGFASLLADNGKYVEYPGPVSAQTVETLGQEKMPVTADKKLVQDVHGNMNPNGIVDFRNPGGAKAIGAYAKVSAKPWAVVVEQDWHEAFAAAIQMQRSAVVWVIAGAIASLAVSYLLAKHVTRPILNLVNAADQVANGKFQTRVSEDVTGELGVLSKTFNKMMQKLKEYEELQVDRMLIEKAKLETIVNSMSDSIIMMKWEGQILFYNRQVAPMLRLGGFTERDFQNKIAGFVQSEIVRRALAKLHTEGVDTATEELVLQDGEDKKYILLMVSPIKTAHGRGIGVMILGRDITLEKELEQMREDFIRSMTHDLRTPLTAIMGYLDLLGNAKVGALNERQHSYIRVAMQASNDLTRMINNILDLARFEENAMALKVDQVSIKNLVTQITDVARGVAMRKNITLEVSCPDTIETVSIDSELTGRLLSNLLGNAIKFTPEEGRVQVIVEESDNFLEIAVKDNGRGIPPEAKKNLFKKFKQVRGEDRTQGTGLGLVTCKYIAESQGGKIWVDSEIGQGSTFYTKIPKIVKAT